MRKQKFTLFVLLLLLIWGGGSMVKAATITANAVTGNWSATGSWGGGVVPTSADDVVIPSSATITIDAANQTCGSITVQSGGTVTMGASGTFYVKNITINTGGVFKSSGTSTAGGRPLMIGYLGTTAQEGDFLIQNDGQFGGTATGTVDGISVFYSYKASSVTIQGTATGTSGVCYIQRILPTKDFDWSGSNNLNLNLKQNITLGNSNSGMGLSVQDNKGFVNSTRICTIYPGCTVRLANSARFHANNSAPGATEGNVEYNIYGTLDLNGGNFDVWCTSAASNTHSITINLGNGTDYATLRLGRTINLNKYYSGQTITMNWNNANSKVIFTGAGSYTFSCQSANGVEDYTHFPSQIRSLSYENSVASGGWATPVKTTVTDSLLMAGNGGKLYIGNTVPTSPTTASVALNKLFSHNNNAYRVTTVGTTATVTSTTIPTWVSGTTVTDANGNSYYCEPYGLTCATFSAPVGSSSGAEITNASINATGNVTSNIVSGQILKFSPSVSIGGNVSNGAGTITFAKSSTIGGNFSNSGTITQSSGAALTVGGTFTHSGTFTLAAGLTTGDLTNNGTLTVGANTLTVKGAISGNALDMSTGVLQFSGSSEQALSSANVSGTINDLRVAAGSRLSTSGSISATTVNLYSSSAGTATLIDNGTLTATTANVRQYLSSARNWYVSSPVTGATVPAGYTCYSYDERGLNSGFTAPATAYWVSEPQGNTFAVGKGYIALPSSAGSTLTFTGTLNSGSKNVDLTYSGATKTGFNLIGNPYPCHLGWTYDFANANSALIESSIWVRTNVGTANNSGQWSYATFNASSSEAVPSVANAGVIAPMQGFWVRAKAAGTLTLNSNLTKSHQSSNPLKVRAVAKTERKRLRLQVTNGTATDEALIYFDENISNGYDAYDSPKMSNNSASIPEIFTTVNGERLVINGMNAISNNLVIPLGFSTGTNNTFTISATEMSNLEPGTQIYLVDSENNTSTELSLTTGYTFTNDVIDNPTRFSLLFKVPSVTTDTKLLEGGLVRVYSNANNHILIESNVNLNKATMLVYNAAGQLLQSKIIDGNFIDSGRSYAQGVYFVSLVNGDKKETAKIVISNI